jgi:hypothetical protein
MLFDVRSDAIVRGWEAILPVKWPQEMMNGRPTDLTDLLAELKKYGGGV